MTIMSAGTSRIRNAGLILVAAGALAGASAASAAVFSLDDPLDTGPSTSDVVESDADRAPKLDPFGKWIVYLADSETDGLEELWSSPLAGGEPILLSVGMQATDHIREFEISPDGTFVAFLWAIQGGPWELYVVAIDGGTPVKKSHALVGTEIVAHVAISADSQWLVYVATVTDDGAKLFRVEVSGSNPDQYEFTHGFDCVANVLDSVLSPEGGHVAFRVIFTNCQGAPFTGTYLYRAGIGDTTADLAAATGENGEIPQYQFSSPLPLETPLLLFIIDEDGVGSTYSAKLQWNDGTPLAPHHVISGSIVAGGNVSTFLPVPFSSYVVFLADRELDEKYELYRTTAGVPSVIQVPVQLHEEFSTTLTSMYALTADGTRVAFVQDSNPIGGFPNQNLRSYSVSTPGGSSNLLQAILDPGQFLRLEVAGANAVFRADRDVPGRIELFGVPVIGGTVVQLNPEGNDLTTDWDVDQMLAIPPDHSRVHYVYNTELTFPPFTRASQVRSASIPAGPSEVYGPTIDPDTGRAFLQVLAPLDERTAVELGDVTTLGRRQLYVSDACLFCDSFEGTGDGRFRWD